MDEGVDLGFMRIGGKLEWEEEREKLGKELKNLSRVYGGRNY